MKILIHACPQRMWYVRDFLIPMLQGQGAEHIEVWNDIHQKGNLKSCMDSFAARIGDGGTWHLQDDVIISSDFVDKAREHDKGIVCGFGCQNFGPSMQERGWVPVLFMWYSFQCIRIPDELARECAEWFFNDAMHYPKFKEKVADGKHDDMFWREFLLEKHADLFAENLAPNIVDHIDYLIGGTLLNPLRAKKINRSAFWTEEELVARLEEKLKER